MRNVHLAIAVFCLCWLSYIAQAQQPQTEMVAMRDGVRLATDVFLPKGAGPFPVVLERTPYNRQRSPPAAQYNRNGYVFVMQDWRGLFGSEGKFTVEMLTGTQGGEDGYDTVEWIARQPWCNGKVGATGGSGPGIAAKQTVLANPPHLVAASVGVAGIHPDDRVFLNGGVLAEQSDRWIAARGVNTTEWPRPHVFSFGDAHVKWPRDRSHEAVAGRVALLDHSGWFDGSCPSCFDDFLALKGPNNRLVMSPKAHGQFLAGDLKYPRANAGANAMEWFDYWLKGKPNDALKSKPIRYYLMGDTMDPQSPGNVWKEADTWPPKSQPRMLFLSSDGGLQNAAPSASGGAASYAYDPRKPAPTMGGPNLGQNNGPQDQRKLRGRPDVLYFQTEPLKEPLTIVGRPSVDLKFSADVPDTTIMVKLIDIYPNGYEALHLDTAYMTRFHAGFEHPSPLESGKIYSLTIPLPDIALVFNKGHRIGLIVTGSNSPRFEVHPNSYEPVNSYDNAPVAHVVIHTSSEQASKLVLPETTP
jgi:predicted acyl esterase